MVKRYGCTARQCERLSFETLDEANQHCEFLDTTVVDAAGHTVREAECYCVPCKRWFWTEALVDMHIGSSKKHKRRTRVHLASSVVASKAEKKKKKKEKREKRKARERTRATVTLADAILPEIHQVQETSWPAIDGGPSPKGAQGRQGDGAAQVVNGAPGPAPDTRNPRFPMTTEENEVTRGPGPTQVATRNSKQRPTAPRAFGCAAPGCYPELFESLDAAHSHLARYPPDAGHRLRVTTWLCEPCGRWFWGKKRYENHLTKKEHTNPAEAVAEKLAKKGPEKIRRAVESLRLQHLEEDGEGGAPYEPSPLAILFEISRTKVPRDIACQVPTCTKKFKTPHAHVAHLGSSTHSDIPRDQIAEMVKAAWTHRQTIQTTPSVGPPLERAVVKAPAVPSVARKREELVELKAGEPSTPLAALKKRKKKERDIPCQVPGCTKIKKFKTPNALASHLNSHVHSNIPRDLISRMVEAAQLLYPQTTSRQVFFGLETQGAPTSDAADAAPRQSAGFVEAGPPLGPREIEAGIAAGIPTAPVAFPFRARNVAGPFKGNVRF